MFGIIFFYHRFLNYYNFMTIVQMYYVKIENLIIEIILFVTKYMIEGRQNLKWLVYRL